MPDPLSSLSPNAEPNACLDENTLPSLVCTSPAEPSACENQLQMSLPDEPGVCAPPSAVHSLVAQFSPPALPKPAPGSVQNGVGYNYSGPAVGSGSTHQEVAFVKTPDQTGATQGTQFEALSLSQVSGRDHDLQATALHATLAGSHAGYGLSLALEGPTARANLGEHNDDGSLGGNIGLAAELVGIEATLSTPVGSLTAGASASVGVSGSMGVRDIDHDGKPELCAKFSIPAYTVGACLERFW